MTTENFISQLADNDLAQARETISDVLMDKISSALDARKQELAKNVFNISNDEQEVETEQEE